MKRFLIVTVLVPILSVLIVGCRCSPTARQAAVEIQETHRLVFPEYAAYVAKDPALDADARARRTRTVESLERLVERLRAALEE